MNEQLCGKTHSEGGHLPRDNKSEGEVKERSHVALLEPRSNDSPMNKQKANRTTSARIPFNLPPYFQKESFAAITDAHSYGKFSGDGLNTQRCTDFFRFHYGYEHCLLTPSCTASLEMAAFILNIGNGDEVIVPSFTFVTTANAFAARGADIIFADSEEDQPNVSITDILKKVTVKTKAIVVVHYAGIPVDVQQILEETNHSIPVVEDCAHAIDSIIDPTSPTRDYVGKAGCLSTFSFHETKNVGIGEGGLLVVNDKSLWRKAQIVREKGTNRTDFLSGRVDKYSWVSLGSSYLMSEIDAAMLWGCLQNIEFIQQSRRKVWDAYHEGIVEREDGPYEKPGVRLRANSHMYFLTMKDTEACVDFCNYMANKDILVATHYVPLDSTPFVRDQRGKGLLREVDPCRNAAKWSKRIVRLPLFPDISSEDLQAVTTAINEFGSAYCGGHPKELTFVSAGEDYWEDIRQLRNFHSTCFGNSSEVGLDEHWSFMKRNSGTYRVALRGDTFVGFIGHVDKDVRLATNCQGKGVAQFMWDEFVKEFTNLEVKVLKENGRSLSFFRKQGYSPDPEAFNDGKNPLPLIKE